MIEKLAQELEQMLGSDVIIKIHEGILDVMIRSPKFFDELKEIVGIIQKYINKPVLVSFDCAFLILEVELK